MWHLSRYLDIKVSEGAIHNTFKRHGLNRLPQSQMLYSYVLLHVFSVSYANSKQKPLIKNIPHITTSIKSIQGLNRNNNRIPYKMGTKKNIPHITTPIKKIQDLNRNNNRIPYKMGFKKNIQNVPRATAVKSSYSNSDSYIKDKNYFISNNDKEKHIRDLSKRIVSFWKDAFKDIKSLKKLYKSSKKLNYSDELEQKEKSLEEKKKNHNYEHLVDDLVEYFEENISYGPISDRNRLRRVVQKLVMGDGYELTPGDQLNKLVLKSFDGLDNKDHAKGYLKLNLQDQTKLPNYVLLTSDHIRENGVINNLLDKMKGNSLEKEYNFLVPFSGYNHVFPLMVKKREDKIVIKSWNHNGSDFVYELQKQLTKEYSEHNVLIEMDQTNQYDASFFNNDMAYNRKNIQIAPTNCPGICAATLALVAETGTLDGVDFEEINTQSVKLLLNNMVESKDVLKDVLSDEESEMRMTVQSISRASNLSENDRKMLSAYLEGSDTYEITSYGFFKSTKSVDKEKIQNILNENSLNKRLKLFRMYTGSGESLLSTAAEDGCSRELLLLQDVEITVN